MQTSFRAGLHDSRERLELHDFCLCKGIQEHKYALSSEDTAIACSLLKSVTDVPKKLLQYVTEVSQQTACSRRRIASARRIDMNSPCELVGLQDLRRPACLLHQCLVQYNLSVPGHLICLKKLSPKME